MRNCVSTSGGNAGFCRTIEPHIYRAKDAFYVEVARQGKCLRRHFTWRLCGGETAALEQARALRLEWRTMPIEQWLAFYPEDRSRVGHSPPGRDPAWRYIRVLRPNESRYTSYRVNVPGYPIRTFSSGRFGSAEQALAAAITYRDHPHHERPFKAGPIRGTP